LPHLICFGHALVILNVDTRVSLPGHFVDAVAAAYLASFPKVEIAHTAQVSEANPFGVSPHLVYDVSDLGHVKMVSLLVAFVKADLAVGAVEGADDVVADAAGRAEDHGWLHLAHGLTLLPAWRKTWG
jgi:hypothetical protein